MGGAVCSPHADLQQRRVVLVLVVCPPQGVTELAMTNTSHGCEDLMHASNGCVHTGVQNG